ncbi:hypothetical protein INQ16_28900, partial [Escherichia coli]|nr:hypothetical protein [Escherichia coli]
QPEDEAIRIAEHDIEEERAANLIMAAATGASTGVKIAVAVGAMVLAFVALVALANGLLAGMEAAETRFGISSKLILCFLRHLDEEDAFKTLTQAQPWLDRIAGVGLDSSELGHPPSKFERVFAAA